MHWHKLWSVIFLSFLLSACGGSLDGSSDDDSSSEVIDPETTEPEVTDPEEEVDEAAPSDPGVPSYFTYSGASQSWIAIQGTGGVGRTEASVLTFQLVDRNADGVSDVDVDFSLIAPVGTELDPLTGTTNDEGFVSTTVTSGKVSGSVRVTVATANGEIELVSDILSISTGLPDQNSFSLSLENHAPESMNIDGVTVGATVRLADKYNNAVPDGTAIYFTTEGGAIRDAATGTVGSCLTSGSKCTLTWESQNPRPDGNMLSDGYTCASSTVTAYAPCINSEGMGQPYAGRVTITAFAVGEESFTDNNADGWFTAGDTLLTDLPEVFFDHNEDGYYKDNTGAINIGDDQEEFHDFAPIDQAHSPANEQYNGTLCSEDSVNSGLCTRNLINVRSSTTLIMASGSQLFRVQQHVKNDVETTLMELATDLTVAEADVKAVTGDEFYSSSLAESDFDNAFAAQKAASDALDLDPENTEKIAALELADKTLAKKLEILNVVNARDAVSMHIANMNAINVDPPSQDSNIADVQTYKRATFSLYIADIFNNRPPTGSTISFEARNGKVLGNTELTLADGNAFGPVKMDFIVVPNEPLDDISFDYLYIIVTTPSGVVSKYEIGVYDPVPPKETD